MKRYTLLLMLMFVLISCSNSGQSDLTVDQAMQAFRDAGLECENPQPISKTDDSPLPKTFLDAKRCVVPSVDADHGLRVFAFENDRDLKMVQDYYEGFSGFLGSYVYVRDSLLFQTGVSMPKELAEQYRETFESLQP